jgi:carboxypeptidase C (cathepsin A)
MRVLRLIATFVLALVMGTAESATLRGQQGPGRDEDERIATTSHQITIGGRVLRYTAKAGLLPIRINETGEIHGRVSFVAYTVAPRSGEPRPLTFLWNGGPGANSTLVHLDAFGPRRIAACNCQFDDNETTWLDRSDLVFVDPVGTGFSRATRADYAAEFYNTLGDIASIAEFVRVYLTRFDAWDAAVFLAGESYGVWRAAGVAETLLRRGIPVAGVMFVSGGMGVGTIGTEEIRTALFIPTRTAAAFFHRKLPTDLRQDLTATLQETEEWAAREYAPALARRDTLTDEERDRIVSQLARFTGVSAASLDRKTLVIARQQFADQLLASDGKVLARFDTRRTAEEEAARVPARAALINRYLRSVLGFRTDLAYQGIEEGFTPAGTPQRSVGARWNYNQGTPPAPGSPPPPPSTDAPPGGSQPWLQRAIAINPALKAFVATGLYDSLNSCALNEYIVRTLDPGVARNITARCYEGGHMMYEDERVRERLKHDVDAFFSETLGGIRR